ncbi:hypothetical protein BD413DRAFT_588501 [Trametes elegans]|nr:hypothetical protein BD413DRAFT_588501 [Trametes elegans]
MPLSAAQKTAIEEVIRAITSASSRRAKRRLADMFLELVNRESWPEYYEVIPQPRCINGVKANLAQNKYKNALDAFQDLNLVFLNALYYNEPGSQISKDAATLKGMLESEWRQRSVLPTPPTSAPSSSAQKVHAQKEQHERAAAPATSAKSSSQSAPQTQKALSSTPAPAAMNVAPTPPRPPQPTEAAAAPRSPERAASPDVDVDVGGSPEPELAAPGGTRDSESDEIVQQLEKGLPRWEGFADAGWAEDLDAERMLDIVVTISKYRDESDSRLAVSLEAIPEETTIPDLSFNFPLSLRLVESRARMRYYESSKAFDKEMSQLFLKARRWYEVGTEPYGNVLVLQRLYHALTSRNPPQPPYSSPTRFAGLVAGPGNAKPLHGTDGENGVTMFRVPVKDRRFLDEVSFKGWTVRCADWLHLSNPDDPSRPIVGQVFKCFEYTDAQKKGRLGVSVSWYYRPEQTFHPASRQFWEKEVLKSSHFADHPVEDIIEKVACQFTARHLRGRPRPPFWYPGWPLYVCDSRYNDRERVFVKIKNWNSCIPEEVRKRADFMPIYPFERPVVPHARPSPFLLAHGKLPGPGGLLDTSGRPEGAATGAAGTRGGAAAGAEQEGTAATLARKRPQRKAAAKADAERAGSLGLKIAPATPVQRTGSAQGYAAHAYAQPHSQQQQQQQMQMQPQEDRSIIAAAGGAAALNNATAEELPAETARHFDRDPETNEVLWFAAPPLDIVHPPPPRHSLQYLAFLARKRKRALQSGAEDAPRAAKKRKMPLTVTEVLQAALREHGLDSVPVSSAEA